MRPVVVVAGRPNVGKSSLVNRIVGRRATVVEERPGVTRDRKELAAEWSGVAFTVVDTGGWLPSGDVLSTKVSDQAARAVAEANLVLFVVDVSVGVTEQDLAAARALRRTGAPVRVVANKVDDASREAATWEFVSLGFGDPWPVSALHGRGAGDLLDEVVRALSPPDALQFSTGGSSEDGSSEANLTPEVSSGAEVSPPRVALVGRPNAGKSTLFNRLIGEDRSIVHDLPGTTRDTIDTLVETSDGSVCFVDTAGMRRRSRTDPGTEHYAVLRALDALDQSDIALLVVDATVGATHQDQRLAERIGATGTAAVVVLNKWDLVETADRDEVLAGVGDRLAFLGPSPVLKVSARSGKGVHQILPALRHALAAYHTRVPTGSLNRFLRAIQASQPAPGCRIRYGVQGAIDPPTFTLFATKRLPQNYLRYVERCLREQFSLGPTPVKIRVRTGSTR